MKEASSVADSQNGASKGGTVSTQAAAADLEADVPGSIPQPPRSGLVVETDAQSSEKPDSKSPKKPITERLWLAFKTVLFYSKLNILLIFVPAGIAVAQFHHLSPAIIFTLNAVAIVPLAGLLGFATESVAHRLGDSLGALLNVTFGNAVELIIFIALIKNEIRIVQSSLLGSILSNLLLILGMSFFLGGMRYREQIYNSTVTQMSACLLSLSVVSLLLPTAFHASFNDMKLADEQSLKISRGTSVVLLLVYVLYLLFQLISHSYLYESTPQHIIDEESVPGPAANWLDSSSDSDSSSSSSSSSSDSDSDSTDSEHSRGTMSRRVRRAMRRRRRSSRSSSSSSSKSKEVAQTSTSDADLPKTHGSDTASDGAREEVGEDGHRHKSKRYKRHRKHKSKNHSHSERRHDEQSQSTEPSTVQGVPAERGRNRTRRVDFALEVSEAPRNETTSRSRSRLRSIGLLPVVSSLAPTVFTQPLNAEAPPTPSGPVPRVRYGIRRTNSLPDRLSHQYARASGPMSPMLLPRAAVPPTVVAGEEEEEETQLSRTAAVILLLLSTGLVAVCAEFMVDSINGLVETSHVGEVFIGLIILPLVGNAAEHFTAITVAMKNKMDLAIGVAIGSSIQIALFITPLIVIIGWAANREMSLYFTLFETVCLFVSAFVANFLILDGRSNYLEGALLMAVYIIIGIIAFFYPDARDASSIGGPVG